MEQLLSLGLGLGLAAACGFRVFVPLLVMSVATRSGHLELSSGFDWIGSNAAIASLAVATILEIAGYYVPWLDNLLDLVAAPAAVVAGVVVTASAVADMSPMMRWSLAVIAGGGVAAVVQTGTSLVRSFSSVTTFGFGNPIVSTVEAVGALAMATMAVLVPVFAGVMVVVGVAFLGTLIVRRLRTPAPAT